MPISEALERDSLANWKAGPQGPSQAPLDTKIPSSYDKVGSRRIQELPFSVFTVITKVCGCRTLETKADPRLKLEIVLGLNPLFMHVSDLFLLKEHEEKEDMII